MKKLLEFLLISALCWNFGRSDIPTNCTQEDVLGEWIFYEGPISDNSSFDCSSVPVVKRKIRVHLREGIASGDESEEGTWTMIYNQGFEVLIRYRTYFSFLRYKYDKENHSVISLCNETFIGKSHDVTLRHWACFYGKKQNSFTVKVHSDPFQELNNAKLTSPSRAEHQAIVDEVNRKQSNWRAEIHEPFIDKTLEDLLNVRGGRRSWLPHRVKSSTPSISSYINESETGMSLDWRDVGGKNYVSPVRNQGSCGSCYAFSSVGMMEARLRVITKNKQQPILSPQDIVSCSALAQGCEGGFPYLIAGKYGWETGLVEESCQPYSARDDVCIHKNCYRWYTAFYEYVGGHYGACSEEKMIEALQHGPFSVSFEVYPDFMHYKSGIYHYTGIRGFEPFVTVNHAVLVVGYGTERNTNEKYWLVKNSWGEDWGESGYFRIRRGVNECGIESIGIQAFPIPY